MSPVASPCIPLAVLGSIAEHRISALPVLVIFPHNQCNCRCTMCDIWKIREGREITPADLDCQLSSLSQLGLQWVVFSGGEPQMNRQWFSLARMFRNKQIRVTMLTAGLLLAEQASCVAENIDDVIVSLDGPSAVHNMIRRVPKAFEKMAAGVRAVRQSRPEMVVRGRCTVQKANHSWLRATVLAAQEIELNSISFLAADTTSTAFNRATSWEAERQTRVALSLPEVEELHREIEQLIVEYQVDLQSGFVVEGPDKLRRIVRHFRAYLGQVMHQAPRCNAPWVSAVIEANGDIRPCFFHPIIGNIHAGPLHSILNAPAALRFRQDLDVETNAICRQCVCSLYIPHQQEQQSGGKNRS